MMNPDHHNSSPDHVLIVEDDAPLRELLAEEFSDAGYQVSQASDANTAANLLKASTVQLVVSDLRLPGNDGLTLLKHIQQTQPVNGLPPPGFIMITAFGTIEQAVDTLKQGADDFLTKPIKLDHLRISAERVIQHRRLQEELARYKAIIEDHHLFHGMLGSSQPMQRLFNTISAVARAEGPVLISGESGTGKELIARAIHKEGDRQQSPFVAINCAGIPPELLESELFGHTASAFTGAGKARPGLFAEADGGSLLLDEIGEMPLEMQAKLLRILQDGRIRPVGSDQEKQLNVRILAATNRDLENAVKEGTFREDLYFRLQTFAITAPTLRERGDDLDMLISHFIQRTNLQQGRNIQGVAGSALTSLHRYHFPGNVRELASAIERAVTFCQGEEITIQDLPESLHKPANATLHSTNPYSELHTDLHTDLPLTNTPLPDFLQWQHQNTDEPDKWHALQDLELAYIRYTLDRFEGNKRQTAAALGIGRRTLYRKLGIESESQDA